VSRLRRGRDPARCRHSDAVRRRVTFAQVGSNVVLTGSGNYDLAGATFLANGDQAGL
jgi:hypothetical protein